MNPAEALFNLKSAHTLSWRRRSDRVSITRDDAAALLAHIADLEFELSRLKGTLNITRMQSAFAARAD